MADILIIGAGIAGLAAARHLVKQGFDVTILEGRDRMGGRIYTDRTMGLPIDLGASWIHGIKKNPIGKLVRDFKIHVVPTDFDNIQIYGTDGKPLSNKKVDRGESLYKNLIHEAKSLSENLDKNISISDAIHYLLNREILETEQENIVKWFLNSEIVLDSGADLDELSLWEWDEDEEFGGKDYLFLDGYDALVQRLAQNIDIRLSHPVSVVEYTQEGVWVESDRNRFKADAVVVTLPLGVLKSEAVTFSPPLPEAKQIAIAHLSMGVLNKVVLQFPQAFWPEDYDMIGYLSSQDDDLLEFLNYRRYTSAPVLVGLVAGRLARHLESLSEGEVAERVMKQLCRVHGKRIPEPEAVVKTHWATDPFSLGSYSLIPPGATSRDREILAAPLQDVLFFAGEATSREYPATVHGAFLSGIQAAKHINHEFSQ
ncbi:MAG TPA: FAD-dependent oxidoreductase [Coleofasciculaceae cyanobacterium]